MKKKNLIMITAIYIFTITNSIKTYSHCEIPCGIYEDSLRIELLYEHITTIEKSMNSIVELSSSPETDYNQLIRWVINKEEHANKIQSIVSEYFLHQRISITDPSYQEAYKVYIHRLELLHKMLVYAMKAKQTLDLEYVRLLRETLKLFTESYFHSHTEN